LFLLTGACLELHPPRILAAGFGLAGYGHLLLRSGDLDRRWADAGKLWMAQFGLLLASGALTTPHDFLIGAAGGLADVVLTLPGPTETKNPSRLQAAWNAVARRTEEAGRVALSAKIVIGGSTLYAALCITPALVPVIAETLGIKNGVDMTGLGLAVSWIAASLYQIKVGNEAAHHRPPSEP
jgi:hypothetical protein